MTDYDAASTPDETLDASQHDPGIGVHELTEFAFCPRAGLIAHEQQKEEYFDAHAEPPRLDYLPDYYPRNIEQRLSREFTTLSRYATVTGLLFLIGLASLPSSAPIASLVAALALVIAGVAYRHVKAVLILSRRRRLALDAKPQEPDPESIEPENVNWWSLLKAGFEPIAYKEKLIDERWRIGGRPKRILRKGTLRIPIFRLSGRVQALRAQHFVRMAAYCHLIEVCEGAESPYGVIFFAHSYDGVTAPNSSRNQQQFQSELLRARQVAGRSQTDKKDPPPPTQKSLCRGCHLGAPRLYQVGQSETILNGKQLPVWGESGGDGHAYHSTCGDRYLWIPPHKSAYRKEILLSDDFDD